VRAKRLPRNFLRMEMATVYIKLNFMF